MGNTYSVSIKTIDGRNFNKKFNACLDEIYKELHNSYYGGVLGRTSNTVGLELGLKQWGANIIEKLATLQKNLYMNCSTDMDFNEEKQIYVNKNKKWIVLDNIQTYEFSYRMKCQDEIK